MTVDRAIRGAVLALTLAGVGRSARAQPAPSDGIPSGLAVAGECPAGDAIWADIRAIVPAPDLGHVRAAEIAVSDAGTTFQVRIAAPQGERHRTFRDADRDCDHRARFAAVFIVLTLLPPDVLLQEPIEAPPVAVRQPPPDAIVAPVPPAPPPPRPKRLRLGISTVFDAAPTSGGGGSALTFGGEVRAYWGAGRLALVGAAGLEPKASFDFGGIGVDELRAPFDLGAALVRRWSRLTATAELQAAGSVLHISGSNTAGARSGTRVELGARIGVTALVGSPRARVMPMFGVHGLLIPRPNAPWSSPQGDIGRLPMVWVGLSAGAAFAP